MVTSPHIVVCVRPNDPELRDGPPLGELDLRAVEFAVRLARQGPGDARVTAVSAGTEGAVRALRECMARGVTEMVQVLVDAVDQDGLRAASLIAPVVEKLRPNLVLCGERSDLGMHGAVPRELAHRLGLPFLGAVVGLEVEWSDGIPRARAVQRLERGDRWAWGSPLPMVCGVDREICSPRYLAVRRRSRAHAETPRTVDPESSSDPKDGVSSIVVESRVAPRIRPKKSKVASATLSASERMKMLRGGGGTPTASGNDSERKRISGDAENAAEEIIQLLQGRELLES